MKLIHVNSLGYPYLELLTPPVIKVPDLFPNILWFFLYQILEFVYPPAMVGRF